VTSHQLTVAGYLAVLAAAVALTLASRRPGARVPSLGAVLRRAMASRSGQLGIIAGWAWLGIHFFAR
jgi:hypothetical protein